MTLPEGWTAGLAPDPRASIDILWNNGGVTLDTTPSFWAEGEIDFWERDNGTESWIVGWRRAKP